MDIYISGKKTNIKNTKLNRFLLGGLIVKRDAKTLYLAEKNIVNINAWINPDRTVNNVGDYLSIVVVDYLCKQNGIELVDSTLETKHLYAVGSILLGWQDSVIWGSGFISKEHSKKTLFLSSLHRLLHKTDVRAVRGPISLGILKDMRIVKPDRNDIKFGDPAILLPLIYPKKPSHKKRFLVIPHYSKLDNYKKYDCISTFCSNYTAFIDRVLEYDLIISSSLHGLILAESYGIPAVMLMDTPMKDITKYKDWYYSTNRYQFPVANTVEEAIKIVPSRINMSVLTSMQKDLIDCFPRDIWK